MIPHHIAMDPAPVIAMLSATSLTPSMTANTMAISITTFRLVGLLTKVSIYISLMSANVTSIWLPE
jgi:hypothetical protein